MRAEPSAPSGSAAGIPLAREGFPIIGAAAAVTILLFILGATALGAIAAALTLFVVSFFRDPERSIPPGDSLLVSPADGRVIKVTPIQDDRFLNGPATLVSIFMSPLNVHINRVPLSGRVVDVRYNPGKYFRAFADKASLDNEQTGVVVEAPDGRRVAFVQIAGFIARRIVCRLQVGMSVARGARYGLIMFGSRADIYLPPAATVRVQVGDRVRGGSSVLAEW